MSADTKLRNLLYPETVALIGASGTSGRLTARPQTFLAQHGFAGKVFPINPSRDMVLGLPASPSVAETPAAVDHAYILLNSDPALAALEECGEAGVRVVSVLADGFAESGPEGAARQKKLEEIARRYDMLVIGPNSTGVVETSRGFVCTSNAAFAAPEIKGGRTAVLSQSGSVIGAMLSRAAAVGLGHRAYVSVGNEAVAGVGEIGQLLVQDPEIDSFVLFLETLRRPEAFAQFATAAHAAGKGIVAYLVGRSEAGQSLAASHTGAMVGGTKSIEAFLDAHGVVRVETFEALVETPRALTLRSRMIGRPQKATVVTTTGGGGGMVYDQIGLKDVTLTGLSDVLRNQIAEASGVSLKDGPLVDVTLAGTKYETMNGVVRNMINSDETGLVVAVIGSSAQFNPELAVKPIVDAVAQSGDAAAPVLAVPVPHAPESLEMFQDGGVPAFRTAESAAEAVAAILRDLPTPPSAVAEHLPDTVHQMLKSTATGSVNEADAASIFSQLGIAVPGTVVLPAENGDMSTVDFDGPYVLKVLSADIQHKSEIGGVRVGLADKAALGDALVTMRSAVVQARPDARIEGYLVQEMAQGLGEAIVGFTRDPITGPMISVGLGGVLTEIYRDIALRPAPVTAQVARQMLDEVKGFATLRGFRGAPKGDLSALAEVVAALSRLATVAEISEAEINPVLVKAEGQGVVALDALIQKTGQSI